ncbi:hypothetical protein [Spiroplasma cantharicola]|uniref:Uncharacterized protein n=1 Tax=Spiroplasma cantharicola TaxID=362837 RepID=A0A0M4KEX3_9MOLU|nr:hypothetical protein [Spiroplasma cantharicola]ALD66620.1 hypothetical protein SCANT_v1c07140 [Spiroplasma cantharicola]
MEKYLCENCKKPATYKKINQVNSIVFFCKDCIITNTGAKLSNNNSLCIQCGNPANFILISQLNRLKEICESCLLKEYTKI